LFASPLDYVIYMMAYIFYLVAIVVCGVAFWKGDRPLRLAAVVMIVAWALSALMGRRDKYGMNYPISIIDTNVALIFVWISMRWRRLWCAVLAALTIVGLLIPFMALIDRNIQGNSRAASYNVVTIFQLVVLIAATWLTVRARRRVDEGAVRS